MATTASVVLRPVKPEGFNWPERISVRTSARLLPSAVRTPAMTRPVDGSITSPTAFTTTRAATTRPSGVTIDAVPRPPRIARDAPASLPTVAPLPAPTFPSTAGPAVAVAAARYPHSAVGLIFGSPTFRSNTTAAGTIGTFPNSVSNPMPRPSR